jgi:Protein of unknown function (DUF3987)
MNEVSPERLMATLGGTTKTWAATEIAIFDPWDLPAPPSFPMPALPAVLRAFVEDRARVIGADPCALAWATISACSAAIDGRIRLRMKRNDGWTVPPALWVALVGRSSTKKTPIIEAAWAPLQRAQSADLRDWRDEVARWKALPKDERAAASEPTPRRRLVTHDGTMEAVQDILARQSRGLGVMRDELAGWIGSLEKYSHGRGSAADRAFWIQAYNGAPYVADRIGRGTVVIENLLVTICGGIQPDRLRQFGDLTDDGLWQRFCPIIVGPAELGQDEYTGSAVNDYTTAIDRLLRLDGAMQAQFSDGAHVVRVDVERRAFELEQADVLGARFASFCGKLHGMWGRLALVLACVDPQPVPHVVSEAAADAARTLIFESVVPNAARLYAATGGSGANEEATRAIAGYLLAKGASRVVSSDLTSNVRICRGRLLEDIQKFLSPLIAGGWLNPEREFNPVSWAINPIVHEQFAKRASQEAKRRREARQLIIGSTDA